MNIGQLNNFGRLKLSWKCALLRFGMLSAIFLTGCTSQRMNSGVDSQAFAATVKPIGEPCLALASGANEFREAKHHWPKSYEELSDFLKLSDRKTFIQLQAVQFQNINFRELSGGLLRVDADYTTESNTSGNGYSMNFRANIHLDGMRIRPFDQSGVRDMDDQ